MFVVQFSTDVISLKFVVYIKNTKVIIIYLKAFLERLQKK